jgi:hypothetical protein
MYSDMNYQSMFFIFIFMVWDADIGDDPRWLFVAETQTTSNRVAFQLDAFTSHTQCYKGSCGTKDIKSIPICRNVCNVVRQQLQYSTVNFSATMLMNSPLQQLHIGNKNSELTILFKLVFSVFKQFTKTKKMCDEPAGLNFQTRVSNPCKWRECTATFTRPPRVPHFTDFSSACPLCAAVSGGGKKKRTWQKFNEAQSRRTSDLAEVSAPTTSVLNILNFRLQNIQEFPKFWEFHVRVREFVSTICLQGRIPLSPSISLYYEWREVHGSIS